MLNVRMVDSADAKGSEKEFDTDSWRIVNEVIHSAFSNAVEGCYQSNIYILKKMYTVKENEIKILLKNHTPFRLESIHYTKDCIVIKYKITKKGIKELESL